MKRRVILSALVAGIFLFLNTERHECFGQTSDAKPASVSKSSNERLDDNAVPRAVPRRNLDDQYGSFAPVSTLIGKRIEAKRGQPFGRVTDMFIDPYFATASLLVVKPLSPDRMNDRFLIPMKLATPIRSLDLRIPVALKTIYQGPSLNVKSAVQPYRRQMARVPFDYYDVEPSWADTPLDKGNDADPDDRFQLVSHLRDKQITSKVAGSVRIDNLMASLDNGRIVYAVVVLNGDDQATRRYAVPLPAFTISSDNQTWTLTAKKETFEKSEPISSASHADWPVQVGRHWTASLSSGHIDPFGGVRRR